MATILSEIFSLEEIITNGDLKDKELAKKLNSLANEIRKFLPPTIGPLDHDSSDTHLFEEGGENYYLASTGIYCGDNEDPLPDKQVKALFQKWVEDYSAMDCLDCLKIIASRYCAAPESSANNKYNGLPEKMQNVVRHKSKKKYVPASRPYESPNSNHGSEL
jgi:hypothetical protein